MTVKKGLFVLVSLMMLCSFAVYPNSASASGQFLSGSFGGKPYKLYVPDLYDSSKSYPLYVMLHGCTQDANQFATGTQMNFLADEEEFLVLYPEQTSSANSNKCWNWFEPAHQSRGSGEPSVIAGMVNQVKNNYSINGEKVYVSGLSAGGAMSVIMGVTYPDIFSGIGVGAGLEYKAATSMMNAFAAMSNGGPNPQNQGRIAYDAMGQYAKPIPVIVFHGTSDYTVAPINGDQVISQWAVTNDLAQNGLEDGWIDDQPDAVANLSVPGGRNYTVSDYENRDGKVFMKKVIVQNMGHAWSGGSSQGSYTDPQGPNASRMMWDFFETFSKNDDKDEDAPITNATPPGGTYSAPITVELHTNKPATTYYSTDGTTPTTNSDVYTSPITVTQNTMIKYFSVDSNGNTEEIKVELYVIDEDREDPPPNEAIHIPSIGSEDGFVGQFSADGRGSGDIKVGDKGMYNTDTYRGILSFDTSILSSDSISSVKLRLYIKSQQGSISSINIDMKNGYFGSTSSIEQGDYSAVATLANVTSFQPTQAEYVDIMLPTSSLTSINKNGKTQFRLKAITVPGFPSNVIEFYGGEHVQYAPKLIINEIK